MDFAQWSPSHTLLLIITLLAFGGQLIVILTYLKVTTKQHSQDIKQLAEQIQRQSEQMLRLGERLEDRIEHSIDEVKAEIRDVRTELSKLNQNHIDHLTHHE